MSNLNFPEFEVFTKCDMRVHSSVLNNLFCMVWPLITLADSSYSELLKCVEILKQYQIVFPSTHVNSKKKESLVL